MKLEILLPLITGANAYLTLRNPWRGRLDMIVLAGTITFAIDSLVTPMITGGQTLHEVLGVVPSSLDYSELHFNVKTNMAEKAAVAIGNTYLSYVEIRDFYHRTKKDNK